MDFRFGKFGPDFAWYGGRLVAFHPEQQAGFFGSLAHRRKCKGAGKFRARLLDALQQFLLRIRMQFAHRGHLLVERFDAAAGKNEFAGHEFMAGMTAAEQDPGSGA